MDQGPLSVIHMMTVMQREENQTKDRASESDRKGLPIEHHVFQERKAGDTEAVMGDTTILSAYQSWHHIQASSRTAHLTQMSEPY